MPHTPAPADGRRSFLGRLGLLTGLATLGVRPAHAAAPPRKDPLVHAADDWLDALPAGHRIVFDAISATGAANAGRFCGNWIRSHESGYGVKPDQLGAVIVLRAPATILAFNDAMWAKYPTLGETLRTPDPATGKPWTRNPFLHGEGPAQGVAWPALAALGVRFIVCNGTTSGLAQSMAAGDGGKVATILQELQANQIPNAHQVATGIIGLTRAQEKGFMYGGGS